MWASGVSERESEKVEGKKEAKRGKKGGDNHW